MLDRWKHERIPLSVARWALEEMYVTIRAAPNITTLSPELPSLFVDSIEWRRLLLSKTDEEFKEIGANLETLLAIYNQEFKKR